MVANGDKASKVNKVSKVSKESKGSKEGKKENKGKKEGEGCCSRVEGKGACRSVAFWWRVDLGTIAYWCQGTSSSEARRGAGHGAGSSATKSQNR